MTPILASILNLLGLIAELCGGIFLVKGLLRRAVNLEIPLLLLIAVVSPSFAKGLRTGEAGKARDQRLNDEQALEAGLRGLGLVFAGFLLQTAAIVVTAVAGAR